MKKPTRSKMNWRLNRYWWKENGVNVFLLIAAMLVTPILVWYQITYVMPLRETCLHGAPDDRMDACRECAFMDAACKLEYQHGRD